MSKSFLHYSDRRSAVLTSMHAFKNWLHGVRERFLFLGEELEVDSRSG